MPRFRTADCACSRGAGALLIKERLGLTDRETVETIQENPYLQFFLGKEEFSQECPFDASLMVARRKDYGRKRFGEEGIQQMAEAIALASLQETGPKAETQSKPETEGDSDSPPNQGKLIAYEVIDRLHTPLVGKTPRRRSNRQHLAAPHSPDSSR